MCVCGEVIVQNVERANGEFLRVYFYVGGWGIYFKM